MKKKGFYGTIIRQRTEGKSRRGYVFRIGYQGGCIRQSTGEERNYETGACWFAYDIYLGMICPSPKCGRKSVEENRQLPGDGSCR